jgi:hypothetical protein
MAFLCASRTGGYAFTLSEFKTIEAGGVFIFRPRSRGDMVRGYDDLWHYKAEFRRKADCRIG